MLENAFPMTALPAQDLSRARAWYADKLGLEPSEVIEDATGLRYDLAGGAFLVFESGGEPSGTHTQMSFTVDDVDATAAEMRSRGVTFEDYGIGGAVDGIVTMPGRRGGWFKDSEGNLIGLVQELG